MQKFRFLIAFFVGKLIIFGQKWIIKGNSTAMPGLAALAIYPSILKHFRKYFSKVIVITGTNGKTSTQKIIAQILVEAGIEYIANSEGSNMKRGIVSTLIKNINLGSKKSKKYLILEVEEASVPKISQDLSPDIFIVTNLFRDQLDAYGEIDRTLQFIVDGILLAPNALLVLNGDDPKIIEISEKVSNFKVFVKLDESKTFSIKYEGKIKNEVHADFVAKISKVNPDLSVVFEFEDQSIQTKIPGVIQVYNYLFAIAFSKLLLIEFAKVKKAISVTKSAFGRGEQIIKDGIAYNIFLMKNPAGANITLRTLNYLKKPIKIILILNDNIADGRDVSWIWDTDFEKLNYFKNVEIIVSGQRYFDLLLRLKYALKNFASIKITQIPEISKIHEYCLSEKAETKNSIYYVMPTYTSLLAFRKELLGNTIK